ncbi:MAG: hypothetical protein H0V76_08405 [Blastocatellia bacterium]|nr:hypothetical protein [Blastocatellia bacterium]
MAKKFDTNPLDPDFPEKVKEQKASARAYTPPPKSPYSTSEFPSDPGSITEDTTRRFDEAQFNAYQFSGATTPAAYVAPDRAGMNLASSRKVAKAGIPEKWLIGLPYFPFSIGLVAGLILLFIIPKEVTKVRFHAAQGLAAHVGILIVTTILGIVSNVTGLASVGSGIFTMITTVMLMIFAVKAWRGKPVHIEPVDDLTNWLEEKIGPLKSS